MHPCRDAPFFQNRVVDGHALKHKREKQTNRKLEIKKNHVPLLAKIPPPGSAHCRRKRAVLHCEVSCGVPQYRQPQPGAQANQKWAWWLGAFNMVIFLTDGSASIQKNKTLQPKLLEFILIRSIYTGMIYLSKSLSNPFLEITNPFSYPTPAPPGQTSPTVH